MSEEIKKASVGKDTTTSKKKSTSRAHGSDENKVTIEVSKYKSILEVLGDRNKTLRVLVTVFFLGVILFIGIAVVASAIKKLYPYSDITTNALGATTIKSENKEVSYWLYNTAQLWANSGITVKEGDVLTIRSSGKFFTAIHHLYDGTKYNKKLTDNWVGSEGEEDISASKSIGANERRKFRMFPNLPTGTLVMQVVDKLPFDSSREDDANPDNFYFIGKERQNIYIKNPGIIYFSLNDIVLNERTIIGLMLDCLKDKESMFLDIEEDFKQKLSKEKDSVIHRVNSICEKYEKMDLREFLEDAPDCIDRVDSLFIHFSDIFSEKIRKAPKGSRTMSKYKLGITELIASGVDKTRDESYVSKDTTNNNKYFDFKKLKSKYKTAVPMGPLAESIKPGEDIEFADTVRVCEMEYYYRNNYKTAWFDDNIGSFLIVIEKESK